MQILEREAIKIKISELVFDESNPNKMNKQQEAALEESMTRWGYLTPIVVDADTNKIADGEHRAQLYKQKGLTEIPGYRVKFKDDTERRLLRQTMNKLRGEHDRQLDAEELAVIFKDNRLDDLSKLIAQDKEDLQKFMLRYKPGLDFMTPENEQDMDRLIDDELKKFTPDTKLGDIYQLGRHRLICADCTDKRSLDRLLEGKKADICFTSPPYNAKSHHSIGNSKMLTGKYLDEETDFLPDDDYFDLLNNSLNTMLDYCHEVYYNLAVIGYNKKMVIDLLAEHRDQYKDTFYWTKSNTTPQVNKSVLKNLVELIIIFSKDDGDRMMLRHANFGDIMLSNIISGQPATSNKFASYHGATFPVYLPLHIVTNCTYKDDLVLDPFAGTGTTLIACEQSGRTCYNVEIDPRYCDIIVKRWEAFTGQKATHHNLGVATTEPTSP